MNKIFIVIFIFDFPLFLYALAPKSSIDWRQLNTKELFSESERKFIRRFAPENFPMGTIPFFVGIAHRRDLFNSCSTQLISIFRQYGFKKIAVELDSLDHSQASFHFFWELKQLLMGEGFEVISVDDDYLYVEINLLLRLYGLSLQLAEGREWILTRQEERRQLLSGALAQLNRGVQTYHQTFSAITQQQSESLHQMVGDISEDFASAETVQRLQEISQGLQARLQTAEIRRTCILYQNSVDTDALIAGTGHILQIMAIGNQDSYPGIWLDNTKILRDMFMTSLPRANVLSA